jgi:hypothetical protein
MLNVRGYSEGSKHQKLNTPNCPTIFLEHYLYVYLSFSVLTITQQTIPGYLQIVTPIQLCQKNLNYHTTIYLG